MLMPHSLHKSSSERTAAALRIGMSLSRQGPARKQLRLKQTLHTEALQPPADPVSCLSSGKVTALTNPAAKGGASCKKSLHDWPAQGKQGTGTCLARMVTLRATSMPARSSRGSGSVKPCAFAWDTMSEKAVPATKLLKMYDSVPAWPHKHLAQQSTYVQVSSCAPAKLLQLLVQGLLAVQPARSGACKKLQGLHEQAHSRQGST